jgi:hypothetical protein
MGKTHGHCGSASLQTQLWLKFSVPLALLKLKVVSADVPLGEVQVYVCVP